MNPKYTFILLPQERHWQKVICPALPGCMGEADTVGAALVNAKYAAEGWVEKNTGSPPEETNEMISEAVRRIHRDHVNDEDPYTIELYDIELYSELNV